jgi:hypothetical protein
VLDCANGCPGPLAAFCSRLLLFRRHNTTINTTITVNIIIPPAAAPAMIATATFVLLTLRTVVSLEAAVSVLDMRLPPKLVVAVEGVTTASILLLAFVYVVNRKSIFKILYKIKNGKLRNFEVFV